MTPGKISLTVRRLPLAFLVSALLLAIPSTSGAGPLCADIGSGFANDPLDTGSGDPPGGDGIICRDFIAGVNNAAYYFFDFGDEFEHLLRVTVDTVLESFGLAIERIFHPEFTTFGITGYTCLAYARDGQCVEYRSLNNPVEGTDYLGDVTWLVAWTPVIGTVDGEIIHAPGDTGEFEILTENRFFNANLGPRNFDCDNPYTATCEPIIIDFKAPGDPVRAATSDNFSRAAVVEPVPEPGTLALFAIGFGSYVLRRRTR